MSYLLTLGVILTAYGVVTHATDKDKWMRRLGLALIFGGSLAMAVFAKAALA